MFIRRGDDGPDPHVRWKVAAFAAGAVVGLVGMALESRLVVGAAIVVLGVGFLLRFLPRNREEGE